MADAAEVGRRSVQAFNDHDEQAVRDSYADNAVLEAPGDVRIENGDEAAQYATMWMRGFPDAKLEVKKEVAAGDYVVYEFTFEGTHDGPLVSPDGEIPATGRRVQGRGVQVFRVQDDKIVEDRLYFDQVQVFSQLGLMPEPAATG